MNSLGGNKRCVYLIHMTVYYHNQLGVKKNKNELPTKYTFAHAVQCTCSITSKFEMFAQCLNSSNPAKLYILFSIITINICLSVISNHTLPVMPSKSLHGLKMKTKLVTQFGSIFMHVKDGSKMLGIQILIKQYIAV